MSGPGNNGYEALQTNAALLDLSSRGRIRATGEDRARLLHALTTNHIQQLKPGQGVYAFFLSAQGRILADAHILCFQDHLLLDIEPETRAPLYAHIDHYIIADDVTLEDVTESTFALGIEGPESQAHLDRIGAPIPVELDSHLPWENFTVARIAAAGALGFRIYGPKEHEPELRERLAGIVAATAEDARTLRIENFQPRYGEDISASTLPQETGIARALHFSKGCYLGQEIVERIHSRGHVNKMLGGLQLDSQKPVDAASKVIAAGAEIGEITSSAYSPVRGAVVAIAILRVQAASPGREVEVSGYAGRLR